MEYKFVNTIQGPVIQGEDEVLFLNQHAQMLDYYEADPEFLKKVKAFVADNLVEMAQNVALGLTQPVLGGDLSQGVYGYIGAVNHLIQFERNYLPMVTNVPFAGFEILKPI